MQRRIKQWKQQHGMTLVETMIALGILSLVAAALVPRFRQIRNSMDRMSARQTSTALESELRAILSDQNNIIESAEKSSNAMIRNCIVQRKTCEDNEIAAMPIYIAGQSNPISGSNVSYTREGKRCTGKNCGPIKVDTEVRTYCSPGGASKTTCTNYTALALRFEITDTENKIKLANDVVEMIPEARVDENFYLKCNSGTYLRGIGLNGAASCAAISFPNAGSPNVERKTCFKTKKVQQPKQGGAPGEMEEVDVEVRDDSNVVQKIDGNGKIHCQEKTW